MGDATEAEACKRRAGDDDGWICDRCGSLWWDDLIGKDWRPFSCLDRIRGESANAKPD